MAVGALVVGIFAGFSIASDSIPSASVPGAAGSQEPTDQTVPGDGTFWVGLDVQPGLYRSLSNSDLCSWTRSENASGEADSVIARDSSLGSTYVHLVYGDFFDTDDCSTWRLVDPFSKR